MEFSRLRSCVILYIETTDITMILVNQKIVVGEPAGSLVVAWLNGPGDNSWKDWRGDFYEVFGVLMADSQIVDAKARERVIDLLDNVHQATEIKTELRGLEGESHFRRIGLLRFLIRQINKRLEVYHTLPMVRLKELTAEDARRKPKQRRTIGRIRVEQSPLDWTARSIAADIPLQEIIAVRFIQLGDQEAWLSQIRRCLLCRKWFFARRHRSQCCSSLCTKTLFQKSPEYLKWRKTYYYSHVKRKSGKPRRGA